MATKKYKSDFILLAEAGFIAVNQADEDAALKLFKAAELLDPSNLLPKIGFGYLHLHKLELKQAVKNFEDVLEKDPHNDMAKAFLGLCLSLMPTSIDKGEKILEQSLKSKDPLIKKMAGSAIDFVEKFVKKSPGPVGKSK
jgi:tetratricopeptide (TPR) repeat protein